VTEIIAEALNIYDNNSIINKDNSYPVRVGTLLMNEETFVGKVPRVE
jgi:cell shape-determining protein MreC